jgi:hypothetical protein
MHLCEQLHYWANSLPSFSFPFDESLIPQDGIYLLFEKGETGHGAHRLVRIGTHTGRKQLRPRLRQHFTLENKDRSIFRKNIGRALLNRDNNPFLQFWQIDRTTKRAREKHPAIDLMRQQAIERVVSNYIQDHFMFSVVRVDDPVERLNLEAKMISTASLCQTCCPSASWLGLSSPVQKIRESGLWLVNELYKEPLSERDLDRLRNLQTPSSGPSLT